MDKPYENRSLVFFAADFKSTLGCGIPELARRLDQKLKSENVGMQGTTAYGFMLPKQNRYVSLTHKRIAFHTLGMAAWREHSHDFQDLMREVYQSLNIEEFNRIGFKIRGLLPQSMSHSELSDLLFGSLIADVSAWSSICEKPSDPLLQLEGERDNFKMILQVSAMTQEQALSEIVEQKTLEVFVENKIFDKKLRSLQELVASAESNLLVDVDLFKEKFPAIETPHFLNQAVNVAEKIISECEKAVLSKPADKTHKT